MTYDSEADAVYVQLVASEDGVAETHELDHLRYVDYDENGGFWASSSSP